jgi:hypothetical protein
VTFTESTKSVANLHEDVEKCEKGEGAKWAHSAYLVREVHLVNVEPKVGRGEKAKPMDNLCEGVKNNEENTMV